MEVPDAIDAQISILCEILLDPGIVTDVADISLFRMDFINYILD